LIDDDLSSGPGLQHVSKDADGTEERQADRSPGQSVRGLMREAAPEKPVRDDGEERKERDQLDEEIC
jgi:hypothetical protein